MPIDTLKAARHLQEEGTFSEEQAERIAEVLSEMDVASATAEDVEEARASLKEDMDGLESRLNARMGELDERLNARMDKLDERLNARMDELDERLSARMSELDDRLTQRIELSEERLGQKVEEVHAATIRTVVASVGAVLAVVIPLAIYLMG